jgi:hypothetical protein
MARLRGATVTTAGLLLAGAALGLSAASATTTAGGRSMTRSPSHGRPGTVVSIDGKGCIEGDHPYETASLSVYYRADPNVRAVSVVDVQPDGTFHGTVKVPPNGPPGHWVVSATCRAADMLFPVGEAPFTVDGPPPSPTPSPSPTRPTPATSTPAPSRPPTASPRPRPTRPTAATPTATTTPTPSRSYAVGLPSPSAALPTASSGGGGRAGAVAVAVALILAVGVGLVVQHRPAPASVSAT